MIGVEFYEHPGPTYPQSEDLEPRPVWRFRIRAANGEIVAQSESYTTKQAAEKGVRALRRALLPGTRDAEAMAKAWDEGVNAQLQNSLYGDPPVNPYRQEIPGCS